MKTNVLAATVTAGFALLGMTIAADAHNRTLCREVRAEIHEMRNTANCASPYSFCAEGTIDGNLGFDGTTFFTVDGVGTAPPESPGKSIYTGTFVVTTAHGELTLRETGISYPRNGNPDRGRLSSMAEVLSGTGRYANASGILFFYGVNGGGLPSDVTAAGTLCLAWSR
jgi:hypothetical protein